MSGYIAWLKSNWRHLTETLPRRWREYRDRAQKNTAHLRLPEAIAGLTIALELASEYAHDHGAIGDADLNALRSNGWDVFNRLADKQSGRIENERPASRALDLWRAMLDTGRAVLWSKNDETARVPVPGQTTIGWLDNSNGYSTILLDPKAAHAALVDYGSRTGEPFTIKREALWVDMARHGFIERGDSKHLTVKARIYGNSKRVVKLKNYRVLYGNGGGGGNSDGF